MRLTYFIVLILVIIYTESKEEEDLYKLLGVAKDATVKEIRKAFKTLAVKLHPDKNKDDEEAQEKFIKVAKAYEILKEPETRKTYDIYGDTGSSDGSKPQYHSYSYYANDFGIYDDDPLIITLSKADYELNILDSNQAWFVNFYSPQCHHCHILAPTWRKLSVELEGVIRLAAVNCEEDWVLCHQLQIGAYPTLLYYEKEAHVYEGEHYRAAKNFDDLKDFILSRLSVSEKHINREDWNDEDFRNQQWLLFLCADDTMACPEKDTRLKLTATLEGLMPVGYINDPTICDEIYADHKENNPIIFWQHDGKSGDAPTVHQIEGSDTKEIVDNILNLLPNPELMDEDKFRDIRSNLRINEDEKPWLICFYLGTAIELNLQLKRLPTMISNINIGLVHCGKSSLLCNTLQVSHYPTWGVLKKGGAFEVHHGRDVLHEVAAFARDSSKSTNLHALSPADFLNIKTEGEVWFIDWYAPWCPPCRKLMPEMRKASQRFTPDKVQFGTVDCTLHSSLCAQEGIRSYPTTIFYKGTNLQQHFHGVLGEEGIVDFVEDMLYPTVITLDSSNYIQLMRKPEDELWVVDYFAPWCGPCQRLTALWRTLAKELKKLTNVKIAQVDCVENSELCNSQNVKSYPTIRLYPPGSKGMNTVAMYNGHREVILMKGWILGFIPTPVKTLTSTEFKNKILSKSSSLPWLVDFYAPWCGHCVDFEPNFRTAAEILEGKVHAGKLDCESERDFCMKLRVESYPTLILYFSGHNYYQISSQDPEDIAEKVENLIKTKSHYIHDEF